MERKEEEDELQKKEAETKEENTVRKRNKDEKQEHAAETVHGPKRLNRLYLTFHR